ncbi:UDP-N-acetylmuramoyl-L-alanyl-D-glutamate--2,6-diaminopimelate ligase [Bacillus gobiensis]|uniref:UDP-N-acetylmuramoyl-L-alanyl-D-glutamate--2, 6-diaminopimelate ligase n=1 Tax=Bacillus gobiensis TaxID=1441095 RepID=UPI003D1AC6A7
MNLHPLIKEIGNDDGNIKLIADRKIRGVTDTSKNVQDGYLFVAIKGITADGHSYIQEAVSKGAVAVVGEEEINNLSVPYIKVDNTRKALGIIAKEFYGNPSKDKIMIGLTGTNGKTTTSFLIKHILEQNGFSCSLIGTIHYVINGEQIAAVNTTPSSLVLNDLLSKSRDEVVIMELSSHGLSQYRAEGMEFNICIFTNLTHDHLDYHTSMENYFESKASLFKKIKSNGQAIINIDDIWGEKLANILKDQGEREVYTIGKSPGSDLKIHFAHITSTRISDHSEEFEIQLPMAGLHNLYNAVMAFAVAEQFRIRKDKIVSAIESFQGVPGRFEKCKYKNGAMIVIDYAHTADAIFHSLKTAKDCGANRLFHVYGFRGNRDVSKRKEMLKISSELSDKYILTFDDLNGVPHEEMRASLEILNKEFGNEKGIIIPDRTEAIAFALNLCSKQDWVVITGKGHEKYQHIFSLRTSSDLETVKYLNSKFFSE